MSALPQVRLTPEQYLKLERAAKFKSEFWDGQIFAMSGASHKHVLISASIAAELRQLLKERDCVALPSDMKVRTLRSAYTYPDVVVSCGKPQFADDENDALLNPLVIVEVLSPSTEAYDRGLKAVHYRTISSLQQYILVSQSEPRVEIFTRQSSGDWLLHEVLGLASDCPFESLECAIPMTEIYRGIDFDPADPIV